MSIEPHTNNHVAPPEPDDGPSTGVLMQRVGASLTPWQQHRVGAKIARRRERVVRELARIEDETMLAEATVIGRGAVKASTERVEMALHGERQRCVAQAAHVHQETMVAVSRLCEDSRAIFGNAVNAVSLRYAQGVEQRAGKG